MKCREGCRDGERLKISSGQRGKKVEKDDGDGDDDVEEAT